jgi:hypothetical protein
MTNQTVVEKRTVFNQPVLGLSVQELRKEVRNYLQLSSQVHLMLG